MRLIIWGAGGHGKVVLDVAMASGEYEDIVFADDDPPAAGEFQGRPVVGMPVDGGGVFLVSIGDNRTRAACYKKASESGLLPATLIHPSAVVSPSARIGAGTVVMPRVVVNAEARIGEDCILNSGVVVEHDCVVGDHVHLSPGVVLGGGVRVGAFAQLGIGVIALPGAEIGEGAVVGAGAVVLKTVAPGVTVVGVPARVMSRRERVSQ